MHQAAQIAKKWTFRLNMKLVSVSLIKIIPECRCFERSVWLVIIYTGVWFGLESGHVAPPSFTFTTDSPGHTEVGHVQRLWAVLVYLCTLPLHTFAGGSEEKVSGEMQLPLGINKSSRHASPGDICKHLYLCAAVGIFTKDSGDKQTSREVFTLF